MALLPDIAARLRSAGCVFAEDEAALIAAAATSPAERERLVERRIAGEPLEYLLGWVDFCGVRVSVAPGVFVPRQRTALLAEQAIRVASGVPAPVVVDLCCGTGAIGLVVATAVPAATVHAADLDPAAVACATANVAPLGGQVHLGDLYAALPPVLRGAVDVLAANAPYVPTGEIARMPPEARDHEALLALDGGPDGLDVVRRVCAGAPQWLAPGGVLIVEAADPQLNEIAVCASRAGLQMHPVRDAERGALVVVMQQPSR